VPFTAFGVIALGLFVALAALVPEKPDSHSIALNDQPSIAVLAFDNRSKDQRQEYFADGVSEDIISSLSKNSGLLVIARTSSFFYKGQKRKIQEIGKELGANYVLEGSVRREKGKVRITAQLIDVETSTNVWTQKYDRELAHRELDDVFAIQDEIAEKIVGDLSVRLTREIRRPISVRKAFDLKAYDLLLRGRAKLREASPDSTAEAAQYFKRVLAYDPSMPRAHSAMAAAYLVARQFEWHKSLGLASAHDAESLALKHVKESMRLPSPFAYRVRAELRLLESRYDEALRDLESSLAVDSNNPDSLALVARVYTTIGKPDKAIKRLKKAAWLDPRSRGKYLALQGIAEFSRDNFIRAATLLEVAHKLNPENHRQLVHLVATYGHLKRTDEARDMIAEMNRLRTKGGSQPYNVFFAELEHNGPECDVYRLVHGLRLAGVPQGPISEPAVDGSKC
jgi:adenylate cyclase